MTKVNSLTTPKDVAKYILEELGVSKPYVLDFESNDQIYLFDYCITKKINRYSVLYEILESIEKRSNVKVYAITHDSLKIIGETYSFLCVSPYPEDWDGMFRGQSGSTCNMVYAFVWNCARNEFSEFGYIAVKVKDGKIVRVG